MKTVLFIPSKLLQLLLDMFTHYLHAITMISCLVFEEQKLGLTLARSKVESTMFAKHGSVFAHFFVIQRKNIHYDHTTIQEFSLQKR